MWPKDLATPAVAMPVTAPSMLATSSADRRRRLFALQWPTISASLQVIVALMRITGIMRDLSITSLLPAVLYVGRFGESGLRQATGLSRQPSATAYSALSWTEILKF